MIDGTPSLVYFTHPGHQNLRSLHSRSPLNGGWILCLMSFVVAVPMSAPMWNPEQRSIARNAELFLLWARV